MKIFISADMEGICGIVAAQQTDPNDKEYARGQKLMTAEVSAVIAGAAAGGATEIVVNDSHASMRNLLIEELHPAARLITGSPKPLSMMQGINRSFQAVMLVGYHAQAGTGDAILDHTWSGRIARAAINGLSLGETGLNAALAGYFGAPVCLVTGDRAVTEEAKQLLRDIQVVAVKEAFGRTAAQCLSLQEAYQQLGQAAQRALGALPAPFVLPRNQQLPAYRLSIEFARSSGADMAELIPGSQRTGARTVEYAHDDYLTLYKVWRTMVTLAIAGEQ
jgi:D-amino peptidase